jgi:hypothetical protein
MRIAGILVNTATFIVEPPYKWSREGRGGRREGNGFFSFIE